MPVVLPPVLPLLELELTVPEVEPPLLPEPLELPLEVEAAEPEVEPLTVDPLVPPEVVEVIAMPVVPSDAQLSWPLGVEAVHPNSQDLRGENWPFTQT